jgi:hypothetical protein
MRSIEQAFEQKGEQMSSPTEISVPLRLTRRGRIVLVLFVMLLLVIAGFTLGHGSSQAAGRHHHVQHTVTVEAGESLWAVAARIAPHVDPRVVVADIQSLNHLATPSVVPGQQLLIPTIG